ncbi:hypothetical protein VPNG_02055 [Cytospora leucostoma]|uniref:Uncharacterized protein n=1 Tax=Cytospora leucostoma TaxID=1230097 RepID=A0A423XH59_9PEZI|nr:hypothetical protein VPNG_02055 [Cytospora leucostoma]
MEVLTTVELDSDFEDVNEFEALLKTLLGPLDALLGPFEVLLGPLEEPYPLEEDAVSEEDARMLEGLELGSSEDPDDVPWVEVTEPEGPEEVGEDSEALLVDAVSELDTEEELPVVDEAEFGTVEVFVEVDRVVPPDDEAEVTVLNTLEPVLDGRLVLPVMAPVLAVSEVPAVMDEPPPGLVLGVGRVDGPGKVNDPESERGSVPLGRDDEGLLLTGVVVIDTMVSLLMVSLLAGVDVPGVTLELCTVDGGTEPEVVLAGGPVAEDISDDCEAEPEAEGEPEGPEVVLAGGPVAEDIGSVDWLEELPDVAGEEGPDEVPEDDGGSSDKTELVDVPPVLVDVPPVTEVTDELNDERAELSDEGLLIDDVVVLGPLGMPGVDELCVVLRELTGPVDRLCWLLVTVEEVSM